MMCELVCNDEVIVLESHTGYCAEYSKDFYVLAESVDVIQLLPIDDSMPIRTFQKPNWKVVKQ